MKYVKHLLTLFAITVYLCSCQKEYSIENETNSNSKTQWEFKEGTSNFKGPIDTAYIDTISLLKYVTILGHSDDKQDEIQLNIIAENLKPGVYASPNASIVYLRNTNPLYTVNDSAPNNFSITITKIDTSGITGTFAGKVVNEAGASKTIKEGKFSANFKKGNGPITPPIPTVLDSGVVTLWSKTGCGGGTSTTAIKIIINGKAGQITSFAPTAPATCGGGGNFTLTLPIGDYSWTAYCGKDSLIGSVTVLVDECVTSEVDFFAPPPPPTGDYFPTTPNSNWTHIDPTYPSDSSYTLSTGVKQTYGTNQYDVFTFVQNYDDSLFYRKQSGTYFQYYPQGVNYLPFDSPMPVEVKFLDENVAKGQSWETKISGMAGGMNLSFVLRWKIIDKPTSVSIGGTTYLDVIKVNQSSYSVALGKEVEITREERWYSRGKGLIKSVTYYAPDFSTGSSLNLKRSQVF